MNRHSFSTLFTLTPLTSMQVKENSQKTLKKAAVLIALVEREACLNVILTVRAQHLRHHPGQVSFPGGKYETFDNSLKQTALRETAEEIGIHSDLVEIIGKLPPLNTVSGFEVHPFIGFVDKSFTLNIDSQEVQTVFEVPITFLLKNKNYYKQHLFANKKRHFTYCIPYQNHLIWGATAQILRNLQASLV